MHSRQEREETLCGSVSLGTWFRFRCRFRFPGTARLGAPEVRSTQWDPGVALHGFFGSCHFELQNDVRKRCTFGFGVTSLEPKQTPATCEHLAHILERCGSDAIWWLVAVAEKRKVVWSSRAPFIDVEAQIHGPVEFNKDIKEVRFRASKPLKTRKRLQQLAEANGFANSSC